MFAFFACIAVASSSIQGPSMPKGFLVQATGKGRPGVLVLHPWWGLNADVKSFCSRLSKQGFTVFAPDLFDGKVAKTIPQAEGLVKRFESDGKRTSLLVSKAADWLEDHTKQDISVVGFSFGAYYALHLSNADPEHVRKVVVFYGTGQEDFSKAKAAFMGHFAEKDEFEPKAGVDKLKSLIAEAGLPVEFFTYPGTGHWFFEPSQKKAYNKKAAQLVWSRTLKFLKG